MSSDVTSIAIRADGLGKLYRLGTSASAPPYATLRDAIGQAARRATRVWTRPREPIHVNDLWALRNVSFEVRRGAITGIIGRNGAGKSTLLKILSRVTEPTEGRATITGRVGSLLEVGTGFHPELTGRDNVYLNGAILGMPRTTIARKFDEIIAFAGVEKHVDTPVKYYSSGMYVRLAFGVAAHLEPEVMIVDEVLAVGDYEFQQKCLQRMNDIGREGRTVLLVSHNLQTIVNLCDRAILLDKGQVVLEDTPAAVVDEYVSRSFKGVGLARWTDPATAPGDHRVRLHAIETLSPGGRPTLELDNAKGIIVRIAYWCMRDGQVLTPAIHLTNHMGILILQSTNSPGANAVEDALYGQPLRAGLYTAECRIPADFLNDGTYRIDVGFFESGQLRGGTLESFRVYDSGTMYKPDNRPWDGVVHPRLAWKTSATSEPLAHP